MQIYPICSSFQPKFVPILLQAKWMDQSFVPFPVLRTNWEIDKIRATLEKFQNLSAWKFALENIDLNVEPRCVYIRFSQNKWMALILEHFNTAADFCKGIRIWIKSIKKFTSTLSEVVNYRNLFGPAGRLLLKTEVRE